MNLIILLFILTLLKNCFNSDVKISLPQGDLLGVKLLSRNNTVYYGFYSIPYAKPPIGEYRFQPPQPPENWTGIRDGTKFPPSCPQNSYFSNGEVWDENCLYLNVFTPSIKEFELLPVMVHIHGGGFTTGKSTDYQPDYFMDYPIVFVSMNYRLGIMGFLSSGDQILPGNFGMKDQSAALRWVQANIPLFGGDSSNVMIQGQSAGGASVHLHMYSPLSKGLFNKAISQSGVAVSPWVIAPQNVARDRLKTLSILTGCWASEIQQIVNCLREIPATDILKAQQRIKAWKFDPTLHFVPVIEQYGTEGAFLTTFPQPGEELLPLPWITGVTSGEAGFLTYGMLINNGSGANEVNENYKRFLPLILIYDIKTSRENLPVISESFKKEYFGDQNISIETYKQLVDVMSHRHFTYPATRAALFYKGTRYFYYYDRRNSYSFLDLMSPKIDNFNIGAGHCDEIPNLFKVNTPKFKNISETSETLYSSHQHLNMWVNFAYNGDPNGKNVDVNWDPVTDTDLRFLHFKQTGPEMHKDFFSEKYYFWHKLEFTSEIKTNTNYFNDYLKFILRYLESTFPILCFPEF